MDRTSIFFGFLTSPEVLVPLSVLLEVVMVVNGRGASMTTSSSARAVIDENVMGIAIATDNIRLGRNQPLAVRARANIIRILTEAGTILTVDSGTSMFVN